MAAINRRIPGICVSLHLAQHYHVLALDQRGHGDSEWARDVNYSNHEMSLDAGRSSTRWDCNRPMLIGHSMGGRNAMLLTSRIHALLRALVIVDVGPELSEKGRAAIAGFVQENQEFDDLEHFVRNVRKYDPYRSREHIERTVKYNMLQRADGKFVSKCDFESAAAGHRARRRAAGEHHAGGCPDVSPSGAAGARRDAPTSWHPTRPTFRDALPQGRLVTVPNCGHNVHGQNTLGFIAAMARGWRACPDRLRALFGDFPFEVISYLADARPNSSRRQPRRRISDERRTRFRPHDRRRRAHKRHRRASNRRPSGKRPSPSGDMTVILWPGQNRAPYGRQPSSRVTAALRHKPSSSSRTYSVPQASEIADNAFDSRQAVQSILGLDGRSAIPPRRPADPDVRSRRIDPATCSFRPVVADPRSLSPRPDAAT